MASWTALNIEPDEHSDDEVDNTKEIQIEEALKLYQAALKLHAQGVNHYSEAADAYTRLFRSEIFLYPESQSEFERVYNHPELELDASYALGLELAAAGADGPPSTLPQILYLSYKNHGQFILDCVKGTLNFDQRLEQTNLDYQAKAAIDYFSRALVSDESDTELWRKAARVGAMLGSRRIARYCLEAAVEVDDDPTVREIDPSSLEEGFAGEQLLQHLEILSDETALSHPIMAPFVEKSMPSFLTPHMDPYAFLPDPTKDLAVHRTRQTADQTGIIEIHVPVRTWATVGEMLWNHFFQTGGTSESRVTLLLPPMIMASEPILAVALPNVPDQIMDDAPIIASPSAEPGESGRAVSIIMTADTEAVNDANETTTTTIPISDDTRESSVALPNRKRSQSTAGIRATPEDDSGTQKRSKRIRDRDHTTEGPLDQAAQFAEKLAVFIKADEDVFNFVGNLLTKVGVDDLGSSEDLRTAIALETPFDRAEILKNTAMRDLRDILRTWNDSMASIFISCNPSEILGTSSGTANAGLAAFLEHSKTGPLKCSSIPDFDDSKGLELFAKLLNGSWLPLQDAIWEWLCTVLPTYTTHLWNIPVKTAAVRLISIVHVELYQRLTFELENADHEKLGMLQEMVQTIFELNIDLYTRITSPDSVVEFEVRVKTNDQLDRWKELAGDVISMRSPDVTDHLQLRYLWATVFCATVSEGVSREHKVICWSDLKSTLRDAGGVLIELQNNAVMPQISIEAAEREVSRLSSMDFFYNLFQTQNSDPITIIETLEPVLDPDSSRSDMLDGDSSPHRTDNISVGLRDMWKFLKTGSISLRLYLWQRLCEAYASISYNTKVLSCYLKCIEIIMETFRTTDYIDSNQASRHHELLRWLKALDDQLVKALSLALNDATTCFEIIDDRHIKSTCAALAQLSRLLHTAAVYDDEIRVGMTKLPESAAFLLPNGSYHLFFNKLKEMQVRTWALQYTMIKEAMTQNVESFLTPDHDLADYLALVHYTLGMRKACRTSNKIFLKMMKVEMIRLKHIDRWEDYIGQVLFDLYGISLGVGTYMLEDHGCPVEQLDRRTVLNIADQVIILASSMPMKDLLKHELRGTIERMQTAVGPTKQSFQMLHNLRNYTEYLKTSIRPLDLYKAWKGQLQVDSLPATTPESPLADKHWYFLLGMIALTKSRAQKRVGPGAQQDDLRIGASFFRLQLQFDANHWETWFRMAQCFDFELEEEVMWSADKINNQKEDKGIVRLQRSAIHCYAIALSCAMRSADHSHETSEKLSEMYYDFGMRMYASSREPFVMEAFWVDDFEKHMSGPSGMYKKHLHEEMTRYRVWKYAAQLFKASLQDRPNNWMGHFMLGKCLWKMYCKAEDEYDVKVKANKPTVEQVLKSFVKAIATVPRPRDSRSEPILEPHYKLVSIVHKFVILGAMGIQDGADLLQQQPFAPKKGEAVSITDYGLWEKYILEYIRHLGQYDKQGWHHRMVWRAVNIIYDLANPDYLQAQAAIDAFRQSIFTKTMSIQVWKPEAERAGRHCVYMERYVSLMIKLLSKVNDKTNMEALIRRVRKRSPDFFRFSAVWTECCTTYLRLIRRVANIPASEESFKGESHEEFEVYSDRLTAWIADPANQHPALDALREATELKKLNANYMKPPAPIDDLISESWAVLYLHIAKNLPGPHPHSLQSAQVENEPAVSPTPRSLGPMNLANLVMDMDGAQVPIPVTFAGSEASRPRKVGTIGRREILRRAEMAVNRPTEAPRAIASAGSRPSLSGPSQALILGSNDGSGSGSGRQRRSVSGSGSAARTLNGREASRDDNGHGDGEESERGSVQDDADDESDLSDLPDMDDIESDMVFPNLVRSNRTAGSSVGDVGTPKE